MKKTILTTVALFTATVAAFAQATTNNTPRSQIKKQGVVIQRSNAQIKRDELLVKEEAPLIEHIENKPEEIRVNVEEQTIKSSDVKSKNVIERSAKKEVHTP